MMKVCVLYHANCSDGFCAAWIARDGLTRRLLYDIKDIEFIPVQYGSPLPVIPYHAHLYILDFCYPRQQLLKWLTEVDGGPGVQRLVILDHHKSAKEQLEGFTEECTKANIPTIPSITFDMDKSGARLTWEHFYGDTKSGDNNSDNIPWLVRYTEDRDLWRFDLPYSREVNASLRSYPFDFNVWDRLATIVDPISTLVNEGKGILRSEQRIIDSHVRRANEIVMDGYKILSVNASCLFSDIAGELAKGMSFAACWFIRNDGKKQWSLRSDSNGIDVSAIAKRHGGGGHYHAAGFEEDI